MHAIRVLFWPAESRPRKWAQPLDRLGALTHSTPLRVILSLPVVQTLSLSNGSLSNPSNG